MRLFEKLKKKHEQKILAKAKELEEERLKQEQVRQAEIERQQAEIERRKQYVEKLLNSPIEKDFIVRLRHSVRDNKGDFSYLEWDYFLCDTKKNDLCSVFSSKVVKITGNNLGDKYTMNVRFVADLELHDRDGGYWEGKSYDERYIPKSCTTIRELNDYTNAENAERKAEYEQKVADAQRVRDKFFK